MFKRLKDKKGISMAEMIIAMAIISIVTAAALTVMISSIKNTEEDNDLMRVRHFASNAVEAFVAAESADQFDGYMSFCGYTDVTKEESEFWIYRLNGGYEAIVYPNYLMEGARPILDILIRDSNGNTEVSITGFEKRVS